MYRFFINGEITETLDRKVGGRGGELADSSPIVSHLSVVVRRVRGRSHLFFPPTPASVTVHVTKTTEDESGVSEHPSDQWHTSVAL